MATKKRQEELEAALRLSLRFMDHKMTMTPDGSYKPCTIGRPSGLMGASDPCSCGYHDVLKVFERLGI